MGQLCSWATVHWVRFHTVRSAESMAIPSVPEGCARWMFGPDEGVHPGGSRSVSDVWCGIALFPRRAEAEQVLEHPERHFPGLSEASEAWHALLFPIVHHGECNLLDPAAPGLMFDASSDDPGGPLFVMTTAGFDLRTKSDFKRLIDFRERVNRMRRIVADAPGNLAQQVFAPAHGGHDAVTMSLWLDDQSMLRFAYQQGPHRTELDRQRTGRTVDRSSFTRFRILRRAGQWAGADPLVAR